MEAASRLEQSKDETKIFINENFEEIPKNISLKNLDFNRSFFESQKYYKCETIFETKKDLLGAWAKEKSIQSTFSKIRHAFLRIAYNYDNTNLSIINELNKIKDELIVDGNNKFFEETNDILELNKSLINEANNNGYLKKIFELIEMLSKYNIKDIYSKYEIEKYILNVIEISNVVHNFNKEISISNKNIYIFTLYYNWLMRLAKNLEKNDKEEGYYSRIKDDTKELLLEKINSLSSQLGKYIKIDENDNIEELNIKVDKEINKEIVKEYLKNPKVTNLSDIEKQNNKIIEMRKLIYEIKKNNNILESLEYYFNSFFTSYLYRLQRFLVNIEKTKNYFRTLDYNKEINLKLLTNFIFFLSYFPFGTAKAEPIIDYYEKTFDEFKIKGDDVEINGDTLIILYENIKIENYKDYNLNCCKNEFDKNRFLYNDYIKFTLFPEKNLFNKYINLYMTFFKTLFLDENSCIKKLFKRTFPILNDNYFINESFLEYIFHNKIFVFNFHNPDFVGLTENSNLNISIKGNYRIGNKDELETEICIFAAYIVILIHELAHYIRIYIFKHLGLKEYEESFYFEKNKKPEIGRFIEKKLFGRIVEKMNVLEALYILDIDNYLKKNNEDFTNGFIEIQNKEIYEKVETKAEEFLKNVGINLASVKNININSEMILKGESDCLNIGVNNDKCETRKVIEELFNKMRKKYDKKFH